MSAITAKSWAADAVSLSRVVLLVPLVRLMTLASPWALVVLSVIVASDLADGRIARRLGTAGSRGALIDASCDFLVVMSAAIASGLSDARYLGLAAVMLLAFLSYGAFSLIIGRFAYTRLGRYDGVVAYGIVAAACARPMLASMAPAIQVAEWAFLGFSALFLAVSTAENAAGIAAALERMRRSASANMRLKALFWPARRPSAGPGSPRSVRFEIPSAADALSAPPRR